ncbi:MAG: LacI family transcriptional regulator [Lachnospiraceae bacterium]|jgi:LacI family transcriptional regulator|nr:LacI family transcriptional regulator [Lachnospiraceae bacterium]
MKTVTINDIAKEAGVSKATVSRVLNRPSSVEEGTRKKVMAIIAKRRYTPSASARNLSRQTSSTVGVIVPEIDNPFFGEALRGITSVLDKHHLTMICFNTDDLVEKDRKSIQMLKEHRVVGLLYDPAIDYDTSDQKKEINHLIQELEGPVVIMDRNVDSLCEYDGVFFDDRRGVCEATQALIHAGHRRIGIINATLERVLARIRLAGYKDALEANHIPFEEKYCYLGDYSKACAYELASRMLESDERPTAVVTCNNCTSIGFLKALYDHGFTLSDVACIGMDRIEALDIVKSDFNYVKRDANLLGKTSAELLIHRIAFPNDEMRTVYLPHEIVIRKL